MEMELFRKNKKETVARNYPTKEELLDEINRNKWKNKDMISIFEKELFKIVGTYELDELNLINKSNEYQKSIKLERYTKLKKFFEGLSEEQINSNMFLKIANLYMRISIEDCKEMISQLNLENFGKCFRVEYSIPETTQQHLPDYFHEFNPFYEDIYCDYNNLVNKIRRIAHDIYSLELNYQIVRNFNYLICDYFQIHQSSHDNKFIASFSLDEPKKSMNEDKSIVEEDFIETTINYFQSLIDLGIVDITTSQEENGKPYVIRSKKKK